MVDVVRPVHGAVIYRNNLWHHPFGKPLLPAFGTNTNRLYLVPFSVPFDMAITAVSIYWLSGNFTSDEVIIGIYEYDHKNGSIINLLEQQETYFQYPSVLGPVTENLRTELHLPPGIYFIALHSKTTCNIAKLETTGSGPYPFYPGDPDGAISNLNYFRINLTYDATDRIMPATVDMSAVIYNLSTNASPLIMFKVKTRG